VEFPWTILRTIAKRLVILRDPRISTRPQTLLPAPTIRLTAFSEELTDAATATVLYISLLRKEMFSVAAGEIRFSETRRRLQATVGGIFDLNVRACGEFPVTLTERSG
jgi:hypothetical protein